MNETLIFPQPTFLLIKPFHEQMYFSSKKTNTTIKY